MPPHCAPYVASTNIPDSHYLFSCFPPKALSCRLCLPGDCLSCVVLRFFIIVLFVFVSVLRRLVLSCLGHIILSCCCLVLSRGWLGLALLVVVLTLLVVVLALLVVVLAWLVVVLAWLVVVLACLIFALSCGCLSCLVFWVLPQSFDVNFCSDKKSRWLSPLYLSDDRLWCSVSAHAIVCLFRTEGVRCMIRI
jgi:hypothetical protein